VPKTRNQFIANNRLPEQLELLIKTVKIQGLIMNRLHLTLSLSPSRSVNHLKQMRLPR
jgi:hypothetical protein